MIQIVRMSIKRKRDVVWLVGKPARFVDNDLNVGFQSAKPPTVGQVYLQFRGYHEYLQIKTHRQSSKREACKKVYFDLLEWWKRTGLDVMDKERILRRISYLHETWVYLNRHKNNTNKIKNQKEKFKKECGNTFMVVSKNKQHELDKSKDKRKVEDATWLKQMSTTREGSLLGSIDRKKLSNER